VVVPVLLQVLVASKHVQQAFQVRGGIAVPALPCDMQAAKQNVCCTAIIGALMCRGLLFGLQEQRTVLAVAAHAKVNAGHPGI
jgi:hypothetical protein